MKFKKEKFKRQLPLHLMLLFPVSLLIIYCYGPMVGLLMAFQNYIPSNKGFSAHWQTVPGSGWIILNIC